MGYAPVVNCRRDISCFRIGAARILYSQFVFLPQLVLHRFIGNRLGRMAFCHHFIKACMEY